MKLQFTGLKRLVRQDVLLGALALGCGVGGAWLAGHYLTARAAATEARLASRYAMREVVVAAGDVASGDILQQGRLAARSMPREFLPPDAVPVERVAELLGGRAAIDIPRGSPIVAAALRADSASPKLSGLLATGERALTVPVDEINSHAGAIEVGDRLDVYYQPARSGDALLLPLLQQVEVLAVGTTFLPGAQGQGTEERHYGTVTLRVTEADAARLLLAQASGELALLLRGPEDPGLLKAELRSSRELLRSGPVASRAPAMTEVLTGGSGGTEPVRTWLRIGGDAS